MAKSTLLKFFLSLILSDIIHSPPLTPLAQGFSGDSVGAMAAVEVKPILLKMETDKSGFLVSGVRQRDGSGVVRADIMFAGAPMHPCSTLPPWWDRGRSPFCASASARVKSPGARPWNV